MPRLRALRRLLAIVAVVGALGQSLAAAERWIVARTPHFEMFSSASESESKRILVALEQFRANFLASFPLRGASEPRTTLVVFGSESQFRPYKPLYEGKPKAVAGFFLPAPDEVMIAMTTDFAGDTDPTEVIFHEYVHLLLHVREAQVPVWFNEGLAELYSTFRLEGTKVEFGAAKDSHVAVLQQSALLPLAKLFAVTHASPDYNEEQRAGIFYAQSWALTHYLVCGEDKTNAPKLARFLERLGSSGDAEGSFREAFGTDTSKMEHALRSYLDGGRYFKRTVPALLPGFDAKFAPAPDAEREFALTNLRWRIHQAADSAHRAHELLVRHPTMARPHELLAAIAARDGDFVTAQERWRQAADAKTDNAFVYVQLAREALSGFQGGAMLDARLPAERVNELRAWTSRALELSPENADAIELSAVTEALAETFQVPAINRVQSVVLKMRAPARTLLALAIIRSRAGDTQTAADIVDLILSQRRADMPTRSAAGLLRTRLPATPGTEDAASSGPELTSQQLAARAAVALQNGRHTTAATTLLDRILAERGTTAPRVKLETVTATASKTTPAEKDRWTEIEAARQRATHGDANAMFEIAVAHARGEGAEFAPDLAFAWLEKAATAGHELARAALGAREADAVCQFLRRQGPGTAETALPPLDGELKASIEEAQATTPTRNLTIAYRAKPRYPEEKRRAGTAGNALVQFQVSVDGQPQAIKVAQATDPAFATAAEACVRQWRFIPTLRDRRLTATDVEVPIRFEITR